jgi:1-deoxy-D-xylulose-5-phosphate reductoisomerase
VVKTISLIGSTGSIGTQALEIVSSRPEEFKVIALGAGKNLELLKKQIEFFKPQYASVLDQEDRKRLKEFFPKLEILESNKEIAQIPADIFISAIVGIAGLEPNLLALEHSSRVAIANKETLVSAGDLVKFAQKKFNSELIPIDSEHVAIHQCLQGSRPEQIKEIILTSSGGPFWNLAREDFKNITKESALKHPTWNMGAKISIDSSTLMNKGLEVIEAKTLFDIDYDKIKTIIHPQSIIHSLVSFIDGNTIAQLSRPDMRVPIQYAIDYPERISNTISPELNLAELAKLEFFEPDCDRFPALKLAYQAGIAGGSYPAVLNSANEAAVNLFLEEKISYLDIVKIVENELSSHKPIPKPTLEEILMIDSEIKSTLGFLKA